MAALTHICYEDWANLPDLILVQVFSYLSASDICHAGTTCKHWLQCSKAPELWRIVSFSFCLPAQGKYVKDFEHFHLDKTVFLDQEVAENRQHVITVLEHMSSLENIRLSSLSVVFIGENPMFCDGHEFLTALEKLLTKIGEKKEKSVLKYLNLHDFQAKFDDDFIGIISANCPNLEYLNILNQMLPCCVSPYSIMILVLKCRQLQELHLSYASLSDDVLNALAQINRTPLKILKIISKGHEKYGDNISSKAWSNLCSGNPDLKVQLTFHDTCPHDLVLEIMKPEIPVQELIFINITYLYQKINIASSYYGHMLENLVIDIDIWHITEGSPTEELHESFLNVARRCKKLRSIFARCLMGFYVIDKMLEVNPFLRETGSYTFLSTYFERLGNNLFIRTG